jgi:S-adenosyl-L-methionine hydrolase (adenosine-forming)
MTVITLTTDFGSGDYEAGVLKGVIWKIAPSVDIADLSHDITPHDVMEAGLLLWRTAHFFPDGTVHVAVVDPGVGTTRRGLAARIGSQYFVGPDNGLFSLVIARAEALHLATTFINLNQAKYWLPEVSPVFHGRDVFGPVAAHLADGTPLNSLGTEINDPIRLEVPLPVQTQAGWRGQVTHIDHFGNLSTNLTVNQLKNKKEVVIDINGERINGLVTTFGERPVGTLIALLDSSGLLAISVVNGSAAERLHVHLGDTVEIYFSG